MKILHLYNGLMNLYGEYGNVVCLKKHLEDQGFKVEVKNVDLNERFKFEDYDFIYCGSGLESNLKIALNDLKKHKASLLRAIKANKYILFTGNAMELLGESIDEEEALNIVKFKTVSADKRHSGDVIVKSDDFDEVVGFINKCTLIKDNEESLFEYVFKDENLQEETNKEGYRLNNLFGTHIIGPILVKNPKMMEYFVTGIAKSIKPKFVYKKHEYPYEEDSYNVTLNALKQRIK